MKCEKGEITIGTKAFIAKQQENGKYRTIFCQLDGYPEVVGATLVECYNTPDKVEALLDIGDIYTLGKKLAPDPNSPHNREDGWQKDVTVAFGRDWEESGVEAREYTLDELIGDYDSTEIIEFSYVFTEEHGWQFCPLLDYDPDFSDLQETLAALDGADSDLTDEISF